MPTPRARVRHAKSVTFDTEAPVINEYEEQTPEPSSIASGSRASSYDLDDDSEEEYSFDRGSSFDHDDSFDESLEDTDKTPVVLPEDWRHMSPEAARTELVEPDDDVFNGNDESPVASPSKLQRPTNLLRSDSSVSEDSRPLPPVPNPFIKGRRDSGGLSGTADRMSSFQRSLPTPPRPASVSKADILGMRDGSLSLDDRFKLMELQEQDRLKEEQAKSAEAKNEADDTDGSGIKKHGRSRLSDIGVPRISRESILRKVKSRDLQEEYNYSSPVGSERASPERSYGDLEDLDPDVPIPSREASSNFDEQVPEVPSIKKEPSDNESEVDVYAIPEMYSEPPEDLGQADDYARESSVVHHKMGPTVTIEEDDSSQYSTSLTFANQNQGSASEEDIPSTPTQEAFYKSQTGENPDGEDVSEVMDMSEFESYLHHQSFENGVKNFMDSSSLPNAEHDSSRHAQTLAANLEYLKRNITPEDEEHSEQLEPLKPVEEERADTPDSVVHHAPTIEEDSEEDYTVPEPIATIKSSGGSKLKTRQSATPADIESLAAYRRQVSGERPPPIPTKSEKRMSQQYQFDFEKDCTNSVGSSGSDGTRQSTGNVSGLLDIPVGGFSDDLGLGLKQEFDRVIESQKVVYTQYLQQLSFHTTSTHIGTSFPVSSYQHNHGAEYVGGQPFSLQRNPTHKLTRAQKGYLMRQNTKVVVASTRQFSNEKKKDAEQRTSVEETHAPVPGPDPRGTRSAGNSPRKPSHNKAWATEPWNGKIRRKSIRINSGTHKKATLANAPPLPGQESAIGKVEHGIDQELTEETDEGVERGRLFAKVVGIKDLDMPLPRSKSILV